MTSFTMSETRAQLAALLDRVEAGEEIAITRHGRVVARLSPPRATRSPRADYLFDAADAFAAELEDARHRPLTEPSDPSDADVLVRALREDRDSW